MSSSHHRNGQAPSTEETTFDFSDWRRLPALASEERKLRRAPGTKVSVIERIAATLILVVLSPIMAVLAVVVKLECPRAPVLYTQERVGVERRRRKTSGGPRGYPAEDRRRVPGVGRLFRIYKFRTMVPDAEEMSGPVWAADGDPRVTTIGKGLRYLRLDEFPQLINVVRGEMRLIGPRPERPFFVSRLASEIPGYTERLSVHPGITGLAQVEREYDASFDHVKTKVKYDLYYARNRTPLLDLKILIKTLDVVIRGKGAR